MNLQAGSCLPPPYVQLLHQPLSPLTDNYNCLLTGPLLPLSPSGFSSHQSGPFKIKVGSCHPCPRPVKAPQGFLILLSIKSKALPLTARPCPAFTFLYRHTWLIWTQPHWLTSSFLITLSSLDLRSLHLLFPLPGRVTFQSPRGWAFHFLQVFRALSQ